MMMKEEEKFERLLKSVLNKDALATPPSGNYTQIVMKDVSLFNEQRLKGRRQLALSILGFGSLAIATSLLFISWQKGWIKLALNTFNELLTPVFNLIPFNIPPSALLLVVLHFIVIRMLLAIFLLKKSQFNQRKYNITA